MQQGYVYKIISPSDKIYIGSTINIKRRFAAYKSYQCKAQIKLYRSFKKYSVENHIFEIIWTGNIENMLKQEAIFGKLFDVLNKNRGLNLCLPKINNNYKSFSDETIEKMSNSAKGRIFSEETKKKISTFHKGKITSEETKKKMSLVAKGRLISEEQKQKMRVARLGIKLSEETKLKMSKAFKIPIIQLDLENKFIREWCSATVASMELNIAASHISSCCKNKRKTCGGFKWKYK